MTLFDRRRKLCQWLPKRCSGFSRVFAWSVFYLLDDNQGAADLGAWKVEVLNVADLSTEDLYCFLRCFCFFFYRTGFIGDKKSSDFYIWETVFGQGCKAGYCSGYAEIVFFSVGFVFCVFFGSSVDG